MSRRTIALLVLLACVLPLGGWLVVGPALATHGPVAAEPPIDLDAPALAAVLQDVATAPVRTAAQARSSAASGIVDKARCGDDQLPVYKAPEPDADGVFHLEMPVPDPDGIVRHLPGEIKPAGVGYTGAMRRIDAALRSSGAPFDYALADWLDLDAIYTPTARIDALVRDAASTTDARVYALAYDTCNPVQFAEELGLPKAATSPTCTQLSAATWARLDPGNGVPWLYALNRADQLGDAVQQREAFERLAAASRFDVRFYSGAAAVARLRLTAEADLAAQTVASMKALGVAWPTFQALTSRCRNRAGGNADRAATCARIAEMLFEHSDAMLARAIGGSVHRQLTGDAAWLDRAHAEQRHAADRRAAAVVDSSPCGAAHDILKDFIRLDATGELQLIKEALRAASAP